jgi:hypothetical protein
MRAAAVPALLAGALAVLSACAAPPKPEPTESVSLVPPDIEFAGLVSDVRTFAEHHEFTDAAGEVHAIEIGHYRQIGEHGCCFDLVVFGTDADGPFFATFPTQGGLLDDCYVENDPGIDRGSHIEILGVLWRKAPGFTGAVPFGVQYPPGTRFCFDLRGMIRRTVPP